MVYVYVVVQSVSVNNKHITKGERVIQLNYFTVHNLPKDEYFWQRVMCVLDKLVEGGMV